MVNLKDPNSMNKILGIVLRSGVVLSGLIIATGTILFIANHSLDDASAYLAYNPGLIPHGDFPVSLTAIATGLGSLDPFSVIELGFLVLLATPVARVALSLLLFAAEKDRIYVYLTAAVLAILLFSMLATPLIPLFNG
ncbi:DUF1634 domain-containing protein [Candidatus Bathyarchaeota archaeon]|nr:MAG: DUF1634 domain-containing protein [Candidatus Bathyarchaeota archaeon]